MMVGTWVLAFVGLLFSAPAFTARQSAGQAAADEAALAAMKVSSACAAAAELVWHQGGYDKPDKPVEGQYMTTAHSSHYNRELKRCLILISTSTTYTKDKSFTIMEEVFDAIEQMQIGMLFTKTDAVTSKQTRFMEKFDGKELKRAEPTEDNLAWFKNLMVK